MNEEQALQKLRDEIDKIDYQFHTLLNQRAALVLDVIKTKKQYQGDQVEISRPRREQEIMQMITNYNQGPLSDEAVLHIFNTIITESKKLQQQYLNQGDTA